MDESRTYGEAHLIMFYGCYMSHVFLKWYVQMCAIVIPSLSHPSLNGRLSQKMSWLIVLTRSFFRNSFSILFNKNIIKITHM